MIVLTSFMEYKPNNLNMVGHSTVYSTDKIEDDKEEVEGAVIVGGGE